MMSTFGRVLLVAFAGLVASAAAVRELQQETDGGVALGNGDATYPFPQDPLTFAFDALEPYLDAATMFIHFNRHHGGQVRNTNAALANFPQLHDLNLDQLMGLVGTDEIPAEIARTMRNSGGGHWNHRLFWNVMGRPDDPQVGPGAPQLREGPLYEAIVAAFGSVETMRNQFQNVAADQFGSGWGWLCVEQVAVGSEIQTRLITTNTPNQDNPLMALSDEPCMPILGVDVWEHSYYLEYQNRRSDYLNAFWNVINWGYVEMQYMAAVGMQ